MPGDSPEHVGQVERSESRGQAGPAEGSGSDAPTARVKQGAPVIGLRAPKLDAPDKVTGSAQYGHDIRLPGMLHGRILYSAHPHARVLNVDTARAEQVPGVKCVLTAADNPGPKFGYGRDNTPFKGDIVRSLRDEVAGVVAIDTDTAEEALALIDVEYAPLPGVFSPAEALADGAPVLHPGRDSNIFQTVEYSHGDVRQGEAESDIVLEADYHLPHVDHACMETTVAVANFDASGRLTLWSTTQIPFLLQRDLAEALGMSGSKIRIIQTAIGGSFGRGLDMYAFEPIVALMARKAGRPVRLAFSRQEEFVAGPVRERAEIMLRAGVGKDGLLSFRDARVVIDVGPYVSWGALTSLVMMETLASLYRVPHVAFKTDCVYTNNLVTGAMRGYGNPESTFVVETMMDRLAESAGVDPVEFRVRNANRPNSTTPQGLVIESCGLAECLRAVAKSMATSAGPSATPAGPGATPAAPGASDGPGATPAAPAASDGPGATRARPGATPAAPAAKLKRGIGYAGTMNVGGGARIYRSDGCGAMVKVDAFGHATLVTGATEIGQGSDTALAQIVAATLGVPLADVSVVNTDTDIKPWDVGVHASRTTFIAGNAARAAALDARAQILETAAHMLGVPAGELVTADGRVTVQGKDEQSVAIDKVIRRRHFRTGGQIVLGRGWYDPPTDQVDQRTYKGNISAAYGFGAQAAEVEVDTETGVVRVLRVACAKDIGRAINPMAVEGQVEGGVQMGLGYALSEELVLAQGRVLNPNLLDYHLFTAADMPKIETLIIETNDPHGPFGAKGVGEMGTNPTAAAIANAIYAAVGVRLTTLPMTPERLLAALDQDGKETAS